MNLTQPAPDCLADQSRPLAIRCRRLKDSLARSDVAVRTPPRHWFLRRISRIAIASILRGADRDVPGAVPGLPGDYPSARLAKSGRGVAKFRTFAADNMRLVCPRQENAKAGSPCLRGRFLRE